MVLSAAQTAAALNPMKLTPWPGAERRVLGLIGFQGIPTPVLDLGRLLQRPPTDYAQADKLLLVRGLLSGQLCALPVGANLRLAQTPPASRQIDIPAGAKGLLGAFESEGETLWALDVDAALDR